jgi:hypothetical protein
MKNNLEPPIYWVDPAQPPQCRIDKRLAITGSIAQAIDRNQCQQQTNTDDRDAPGAMRYPAQTGPKRTVEHAAVAFRPKPRLLTAMHRPDGQSTKIAGEEPA